MRVFKLASMDRLVCPFGRRLYREQLDALTVELHFQLVRLAEAFDLFIAVAHQADLNLVLAILRKLVRDRDPAARADRQSVEVRILRNIGRHSKGFFPRRFAQRGRRPGG